MNVTAIIPAAGKGIRMREGDQKPFLLLHGRPILAHTLGVFEACDAIDQVILVVSEEMVTRCADEIINTFGFNKVKETVSGGQRRQDSVHNGLTAIRDRCDVVVIHDGVRPLVRKETILRSIELCQEHQAVITAVPPKDTIKRGDDGYIVTTLDRAKLWSVQTPQSFSYNVIVQAYEQAREDQFWGTDDASLVERLGVKIKILEGAYDNIKITTREDLYLAEKLLERGAE